MTWPLTQREDAQRGPSKCSDRPGSLYVYRIYGIHWMLNVVTGEIDYPAAVLIRSVEAIFGPGRLTRALALLIPSMAVEPLSAQVYGS